MRRLPILLVFSLMFALLVLAPASADKPVCDGAEPHPSCKTDDTISFEECVFDDGVLTWDGTEIHECTWDVQDPTHTFEFQIDSQDVTEVKLPHMIVNVNVDGEIVFPSFKCFDETRRGIQELPFPGDDLWKFSPHEAGCGEGPYLLTVAAMVKRGTLELKDLNYNQ